MDKTTLSSFGWIVIAVIIISLLIAFAPKYGSTVEDGYYSTVSNLLSKSDIAQHSLTVSENDKGTITFENKTATKNGKYFVSENEKISFNVTPNTGYKYTKVIITSNDKQYTILPTDVQEFTVLSGDINIELFFEKI